MVRRVNKGSRGTNNLGWVANGLWDGGKKGCKRVRQFRSGGLGAVGGKKGKLVR